MIYAMSDIHGCIEKLEEMLPLVDLSGENRLIFLGDYIDYGRASGRVLKRVLEIQKQYGSEKVVVLKGNHEAMLLEWIDEFNRTLTPEEEEFSYDSWLKTDSEHYFNTFRTLVPEEAFEKYSEFIKTASFGKMNTEAVKLVMQENGELIRWIRNMPTYYETESQIFIHAGVDEEAEEYWKWGSGDEMFLWKFPASRGRFIKTIIAGHVGTGNLARNSHFHDVYFDGESHYYIDGTAYKYGGKLLLLGYNESDGKYYQIDKERQREVRKFERL